MRRLNLGLFVVTILFLAGCLTTSASAQSGQSPPAGYTGPIAHRPEWKVGDRLEWEVERGWKQDKRRYTILATITEITAEGPIVRSEVKEGGRERVVYDHYTKDLNWYKAAKEGQVIDSVSPELKYLNWPLWIGKEWSVEAEGGTYRWIDHFRVIAFETIQVPAGTYETFRIDRWVELLPSRKPGYTRYSAWYSPKLGRVILTEGESSTTGPRRQSLLRFVPAGVAEDS